MLQKTNILLFIAISLVQECQTTANLFNIFLSIQTYSTA